MKGLLWSSIRPSGSVWRVRDETTAFADVEEDKARSFCAISNGPGWKPRLSRIYSEQSRLVDHREEAGAAWARACCQGWAGGSLLGPRESASCFMGKHCLVFTAVELYGKGLPWESYLVFTKTEEGFLSPLHLASVLGRHWRCVYGRGHVRDVVFKTVEQGLNIVFYYFLIFLWRVFIFLPSGRRINDQSLWTSGDLFLSVLRAGLLWFCTVSFFIF